MLMPIDIQRHAYKELLRIEDAEDAAKQFKLLDTDRDGIQSNVCLRKTLVLIFLLVRLLPLFQALSAH